MEKLQHPLWTDNSLLTSANTYPSLHSLPSVRPGSNPSHTPSIRERHSYLCWEPSSLLPLSNSSARTDTSPRPRGQGDRWPVSSSWHPRPSACCHCSRSPASGCRLTRRSDTQPRRVLSATSGTWCGGGTKKLLEKQAARFVPNVPLPSLHVSSPAASKQALSWEAQHTSSQHTQGSQLLYRVQRWFSLSTNPPRWAQSLLEGSSSSQFLCQKPLSRRQCYSLTVQMCPSSLWVSSLDLEGPLKLWNPSSSV